MKTFVALLGVSTAFGVAIAVAYWFVADKEATGTALLAVMVAALTFAAGYALVAERDANLDGDRPAVPVAEVDGEDLGVFSAGSAWPIVTAVSIVLLLTGVVFWAPLAAIGAVILTVSLWRMGAQSART